MSSALTFYGIFSTANEIDSTPETFQAKVAIDVKWEAPNGFQNLFDDVLFYEHEEPGIEEEDRTWEGETYEDVEDIILDYPQHFAIRWSKVEGESDYEVDLSNLQRILSTV